MESLIKGKLNVLKIAAGLKPSYVLFNIKNVMRLVVSSQWFYRRVVSLIVFCFAIYYSLSTIHYLYAAGPGKINYQGRLREHDQPVSGIRSINFRIYDAPSGGNLKWESGAQNIQVSTGIFSYQLAPNNIDWSTGNYYLELVIQGTPLSPREQLVASPYSLYSDDSDTLDGRDYTAFVSTRAENQAIGGVKTFTSTTVFQANVGIGTTWPAGPLHVVSGTTDIIRTDTSGRVTMPNQPAFYAFVTVDQPDTSTGEVAQKVLFAGTRFNVGNHFSTVNSRFTAPVAGLYFFHGEVRINNFDGGYVWAHLFLNGSPHIRGGLSQSASTSYRQVGVTGIINMSAGDYVEFWETTYADASCTIMSGETESYFMGYLIR